MKRCFLLIAALLAPVVAHAAEPVRIGITTILSGPYADRGQSEQFGPQLALTEINEAGGVLGRAVEAFYADNACKADIGAIRRAGSDQPTAIEQALKATTKLSRHQCPMTTIMRMRICSSWTGATANRL